MCSCHECELPEGQRRQVLYWSQKVMINTSEVKEHFMKAQRTIGNNENMKTSQVFEDGASLPRSTD